MRDLQGFGFHDDYRSKGKTRADAETLIQEFRDMATGTLDLECRIISGGSRYLRACGICRRG